MRWGKTIFLLVIGCCLSFNLFAFKGSKKKKIIIKNRFGYFQYFPFYKPNSDYSANSYALFSPCASFRFEPLLRGKLNPIWGIDYIYHGLSVDSYYFKEGHSNIYDKKFNYNHRIRYQEIQFPLLLKQSILKEDNSLFSFYILGGWVPRYIYYSHTVITQITTDIQVYKGSTNPEFEHGFTHRFNSSILGGLGYQSNSVGDGNAWFIEVAYKFGLSRIKYKGASFSNELLIKDSGLFLGVGLRF